MGWTQIAVAVVMVLSAVAAVWRHILSRVEQNKQDLQEHKLHVAETYVTKTGMHEQTSQIMNAIADVDRGVGRLNERIDRVIEQQATAGK